MPYFYDFSSGYFADNVISGLQMNCDFNTLMNLNKRKLLYFIKPTNTLTHQSICFDGLEAYAEAAKLPVSYFFFGSNTAPIPRYTPYDLEILWYLDRFSVKQLFSLKEAMELCFPNRTYHEASKISAHRRLLHLILAWPPGTLVATVRTLSQSQDPDKRIVFNELARYKDSHYSSKLVFSSDAWPALANYFGVSLHWLFQLKTPLYCKTQLADEIFDYFTLLQPSQQQSAYQYITGKKLEVQ